MNLESRIEAIEERLGMATKPICVWWPGTTYQKLGVDPQTEVDIKTLLRLNHNVIYYRYHLLRPEETPNWTENLIPVPIEQDLEVIVS